MDTVGDAYIVAGWLQELDSKEVSVSEEAIKQKSEIGLFESSIVHTQVTNT